MEPGAASGEAARVVIGGFAGFQSVEGMNLK